MRILCLRALFAEQIFDVDGIMARARFFLKNRIIGGATVCFERGLFLCIACDAYL